MEVDAHYLARSTTYWRRGKSSRYDLDMGSFGSLDNSRMIGVLDTFAQLNPMANLFMLGYRGDGEGMASWVRDQGWEV